jgi:hypothetical protein
MTSPAPTTQILEKADYRKQHLFKLPEEPLLPLGESQVRIRSSIISLTTNNFTYARLGDMLGWWNVWSPLSSLQEPYTDSSKYGRISAWGYATVIDSAIASLPMGTKLYGYLPISTVPEVLTLEESTAIPGHFVEKSPHRQHLFNSYNRYLMLSSIGLISNSRQSMGMDSLIFPAFETAFNLNRHVFPWEPGYTPIKPGFGIPNNPELGANNTSLRDTVVVILSSSGKTALSFALQLKNNRPVEHRPAKVISVSSEATRPFLENTGLFDHTLLYTDINDPKPPNLDSILGSDSGAKIALFNFGARGDAASEWADAAKDLGPEPPIFVAIGSDPIPVETTVMASRFAKNAQQGWVRTNASGMKDLAMEMLGERGYFEEVAKAREAFIENGGIPGLALQWGRGMEEVGEGWDKLAKGMVGPETGLVFEL